MAGAGSSSVGLGGARRRFSVCSSSSSFRRGSMSGYQLLDAEGLERRPSNDDSAYEPGSVMWQLERQKQAAAAGQSQESGVASPMSRRGRRQSVQEWFNGAMGGSQASLLASGSDVSEGRESPIGRTVNFLGNAFSGSLVRLGGSMAMSSSPLNPGSGGHLNSSSTNNNNNNSSSDHPPSKP
eukprot:CAMPEP_0173426622 /NCGR_PEP_ID=MMETSP1357-20121228/6046_1 /TAXON_ID=77926 /ORGANISM="Hemiselmis rufescens, Strain PCC563" /LENGTH=181 /DNA_ID=CAMNT_0014390327 /DNA_START=21 /DNA_END=563 /DNA_ORIENTATION=+